MSYASYISAYPRRNGFGVELFRKTLVVKQDPSKPSTGAIVHAKADGCERSNKSPVGTIPPSGA